MLLHAMEFLLNPNNPDEVFMYISDEIVPNIKPWYLISNYGNVFSTNSNRLMKPTKSADGYNVCTVRTYDEKGITIYIHRVEMLTFKYEPGCLELDIDHIDCNKSNNYIVNLEWVTKAENTRRASINGLLLTGEDAPWTKVNNDKAHKICQLYLNGYGVSSIARQLDCGIDSVFRIIHGIGRQDVSSQYDIESRYRGRFTDEQIHSICNIFQQYRHMDYSAIKPIIEQTLCVRLNRDLDCIVRNLYRRDPYCYYRISSMYEY